MISAFRPRENVAAVVIAKLRSRGLMRANGPIFSVGFSNGGAFASYAAHVGKWQAAAIYCSSPGPWAMTTTVPHIWNMGVNDSTLKPRTVIASRAFYDNLISRRVAAQYNNFSPSPVYPERFWRINPLTSADSNAIYNALKQNGFLDENNFLIQNPRKSNWKSVIPPPYQPLLNQIEIQLKAAFAEHQFMSDSNYRTIQFFNARL